MLIWGRDVRIRYRVQNWQFNCPIRIGSREVPGGFGGTTDLVEFQLSRAFEKILFSTPVWYPDRAALERNINNNKYNHIKFLLK